LEQSRQRCRFTAVIRAGELIFGDFEGLVAIPLEIEDKVIELATKKVAKRKRFPPRTSQKH
jgi:regulator of RNase E activity RraA